MSETIKISIELADAAAQKALTNFANKATGAEKGVDKLGKTGKSSLTKRRTYRQAVR